MANVLVVSTVDHPERVLGRRIDASDVLKVVVPVVRQGVLDWLANDQRAFALAERVAKRAGEELPGETVEAAPGEADVDLAIRDALATFDADEILVVLRPDDEAGIVEAMARPDAPGRSVYGIPLQTVVTPDA